MLARLGEAALAGSVEEPFVENQAWRDEELLLFLYVVTCCHKARKLCPFD